MVAYDAEGKYLGIYLGSSEIYIPSLKLFMDISRLNGDVDRALYLYFESNDCSGTTYVRNEHLQHIFGFGEDYYYGEAVIPVYRSFSSYHYNDSDICHTGGTLRGYVVPAQQFTPPFAVPVALPLSFDHEPAHPGKWSK